MKNTIEVFKLLTDELRVRILMLLDRKELSVCQLMGTIGASQPLISRNLSLLYKGGFLDERRDGKLRFYSIKSGIAEDKVAVLVLLRTLLKSDTRFKEDLETLAECTAFQKKAGRCDMKTLTEFMKLKERKMKGDRR
ncbi:MAG: winged helix-turn-helix transcriptional regulator [Nitrospirae bacterium]|nr:winged helix-turn-helix transcriptional regulator [Nitrospirota bacterium]